MTSPERADVASELADAAIDCSALVRAVELGRCAGRAGFDWSVAHQVRAKVIEELSELDAAEAHSACNPVAGRAAVVEELGDLLFAIANWARHLGVEPEAALIAANAKFERRFTWMERTARARSVALSELTEVAWEALWRESKAAVG